MKTMQSFTPPPSDSLFEQIRTGRWRAEQEKRKQAPSVSAVKKPARESLAARLEEEKQKKEEKVNGIKAMELPVDFENAFKSDERARNTLLDSVADGLVMSLHELGRVDIEYIAEVTARELREVILELKGAIYQNPDAWGGCFYKGWETADEYLSGNLMQKLKRARALNEEYAGWFDGNVKALEGLLPKALAAEDIYLSLGSPWLPAHVVEEFILFLLGKPYGCNLSAEVLHDELTGSWEITNKQHYAQTANSYVKYGTRRMEALRILEHTLNMQDVAVFDSKPDPRDRTKTRRELNEAETVHAMEKQRTMIDLFRKWVWEDEGRKKELQAIYEEQFAYRRVRKFDGAFLKFPSMSKSVALFPYQRNAVARIVFTPNTLLAHEVGAGKTYVMIAAGMELKRMGLSSKNLFVVPNNILGQWKEIYLSMYPNANIFVVEPKLFTPKKRRETLEYVRDHDFDGVIMAYSCFDRIPLSKRYVEDRLLEEQGKLHDLAQDKSRDTFGLRRAKEGVKKDIERLRDQQEKLDSDITFDKLGFTRMFVDEAHNYKNVPVETQIERVRGIGNGGSLKCVEMLAKVRYIQRRNGGGGVVMATGTPLTNSITDAFVMQQYLQPGELALLDLQSFDAWCGQFCERQSEFEIDVDTNNYRLATRFSKFHNLPELTSLLASVADFHSMSSGEDLPLFQGHRDVVIEKTEELEAYLQEISKRADLVHSGKVSRKDDNMLVITTDGRKAALDMRLANKKLGFNPQSKVYRCAEIVLGTYLNTRATKRTQLVFCDSSTPKDGFNMYDELRRLLELGGIPEDEIAYIHDATTEKQREQLFEDVQRGKIAVLIGSTFKLGLGVNVQKRLLAVHHLDVPWRPADMVQREGRILRQGNTNKEVYIYRYITEGSFDSYSWQILEVKQRFISALLSGSMTQRSGSDIEDIVLDYAEVKALAVGNELIKLRVETANELGRYQALQRKTLEARESMQRELAELPGLMQYYRDCIAAAEKDKAFYEASKRETPPEQRRVLRSVIYNAAKRNLMNEREEELITYQGFQIMLPAGMTAEEVFVYVKGEGKYPVTLGESDVGALVRIDNCLENFSSRISKWYEQISDLHFRSESIQRQLEREESYHDDIERLKERLQEIDKELKVKA